AKELAARVMVGDKPLAETERFREKLAALEVELKALEITQMRVVANARNLPPGVQDPASSVLKLKGTELAQAATEILMEVAGANAMAWQSEQLWGTAAEEPIGPEWAATVAPDYFYTRAASIYGGSNEIQRNVIAKRILGLYEKPEAQKKAESHRRDTWRAAAPLFDLVSLLSPRRGGLRAFLFS